MSGQENKLFAELCAGIWMEFGKRKDVFIKNHITRDVHSARSNIKALIAFMHGTITQEHTLFGAEFKFMFVKGAQVGPHGTTKYAKKSVVRFSTKEPFEGSLVFDDPTRHTINKINRGEERLIPKLEWHKRMGKKGQTNLNNMPAFSFGGSILLVSVGA